MLRSWVSSPTIAPMPGSICSSPRSPCRWASCRSCPTSSRRCRGRARQPIRLPASRLRGRMPLGEAPGGRRMAGLIVIRGGTVIDGTGAPGRRADVAIEAGRIREIGANLRGGRELDASGCIVTPGFIDLHTHYDAQVFWDPALSPSCFHGVTTVIAGNCGFSIAPTRPEHRETIARTLENVEDMDVAALAAGIPWDFET